MRARILVFLAFPLAAAIEYSACSQTPTAPSSPSPPPSPSASPTYPTGKPDATAFENLQLIRDLERASGRQSDLVFIGGGAKLDGHASPGAGWTYQFAEGTVRVVQWGVSTAGQVTFRPNAYWSDYRQEKKEIGPSLRLDSPAVIASALRNGGQAFVNQFPGAKVKMLYAHLAGVVHSQVTFYALGEAPCELGPIVVDARTGQLLTRELSCLDRLD